MTTASPRVRLLAALASLGAATCCERGPYVPAVEWGEALFASPSMSPSAFNEFSCATCHVTTEEPPPGVIPSGYSMRDVAFRESWWGGYEPTLLDAVNFCLVYFMRGDPLTREDPKGRALYEYLASLSPTRPAPPRPFTVVENLPTIAAGDPARGREVYEGACKICHGSFPGARGRIGDLVPRLEAVFAEYPEDFPGIAPGLILTEKIRHGQFFGVGGNMPPYAVEVLSDADIGALIAYFGL